MSAITNTKNFNNENHAIFAVSLNDIENEISDLASYNLKDLNTPENLADRLSSLNQTIPDQDSMELSTKIMGLAYILDEKVSQSYLPDQTKKNFSAELQVSVPSSYCKLPLDLIQLIASYLPVKELVAFAQVDRRTYKALDTLKISSLKIFLETKVTGLNKQIEELRTKAQEQLPNTFMYLAIEGRETFFFMADFESAERLSFKHDQLRQHLSSSSNSSIQSQYQLLSSKETKQRELALITSHISEFNESPVKLQIGYINLLKQIHLLSEKDMVKSEDVEEICAQLQKVQQYFTSNPAIELEFGHLYNHLIYAFERKLDELRIENIDTLLKQITPKNQLSNFPHDVLYLIFENLDLQDQVALRSVCKKFKEVIDSRTATKAAFLSKKVMHLKTHESNLNWKYERAQFLLKTLDSLKPDYHPSSQRWKEYVEKRTAMEEEIKIIRERLQTIRTNLWEIDLPDAIN